jgi:hypothetical protein
MNQESLRELLARVHERLNQAGGSVDAESRGLLSTVMRDIERTLGNGDAPAPATAAGAHVPRLEALAVRFEADYPSLAETLRQILDVLGKAGL